MASFMSCEVEFMIGVLLGRLISVGVPLGRASCSKARVRTRVCMSGRHDELSRDSIRDLHPQDLVPGDVLLARTTPRPLPRNHGATLEDLATPDAPRLLALHRAGQALHPDPAVAAQRLGQFELGR